MEHEAIIEPKKCIIHLFHAGIFFFWYVETGQLVKFRTISFQSLLLYWYSCYSNLVFLRAHAFNKSKMTLSADVIMSVLF